MQISAPFRHSRMSDAPQLAELVNFAGEGMPLYLWEKMAVNGEPAWHVGRRRAAREDGSFSYRNAYIVENQAQVAGCLIGYETPAKPEPVATDMPGMFVPLQELENLVPATWYVNILAVMPKFRGRGLGTKLLALADEIGMTLGKIGMSVIVSDSNLGARQLYERSGYLEVGTRKMVKNGWSNSGQNWVLLAKEF